MMALANVVPDLNLQPGELYLARGPAILRTILGSCVGVTFWSRKLRAGALCHGVLPNCPANWPAAEQAAAFRYVDFSIRHLAGQFDRLGACRRDLEVKLFGGADVLPVDRLRSGKPTVGAQNCAAALETLSREGFVVAASDLGGQRGRRIHFHTGTGRVLLHRLAEWKEPS